MRVDHDDCRVCEDEEDERDLGTFKPVALVLIDDLPAALEDGWAPITTKGFSKIWTSHEASIWVYRVTNVVN